MAAALNKKAALQLSLLDEIAQFEEPDIGYTGAVFAQVAMPYRDPRDVQAWARRNGALKLIVRPGIGMDEKTGQPRSLGIPFGIWPRLLIPWMCTEAVRTRSPRLEMASSLSEFIRVLNAGPSGTLTRARASGGKEGNATRLKEQMTRLFHANLTILRDDTHADGSEMSQGVNLNVVSGWKVHWAAPGAKGSEFKGGFIHLSQELFQEITERPVPLDLNDLRVLSRGGSPMRLDIYTWLVHRFSYLSKPTTVPWESLKLQLGTGLADTKQGLHQFKKNFTDNLPYVLEVYKDAKVDVTPAGVRLKPSRTRVPFKGTRGLRALT